MIKQANNKKSTKSKKNIYSFSSFVENRKIVEIRKTSIAKKLRHMKQNDKKSQ
jgi:hypothetical protein